MSSTTLLIVIVLILLLMGGGWGGYREWGGMGASGVVLIVVGIFLDLLLTGWRP